MVLYLPEIMARVQVHVTKVTNKQNHDFVHWLFMECCLTHYRRIQVQSLTKAADWLSTQGYTRWYFNKWWGGEIVHVELLLLITEIWTWRETFISMHIDIVEGSNAFFLVKQSHIQLNIHDSHMQLTIKLRRTIIYEIF